MAAGCSMAVAAAAAAAAATITPTTTTHGGMQSVGALLRPFDPGKLYRRSTRRDKVVLGVDLPFDRGKEWGRMQHGE